MNLIYIGKIKINLDFSKLLFIDLYTYIYHFLQPFPFANNNKKRK